MVPPLLLPTRVPTMTRPSRMSTPTAPPIRHVSNRRHENRTTSRCTTKTTHASHTHTAGSISLSNRTHKHQPPQHTTTSRDSGKTTSRHHKTRSRTILHPLPSPPHPPPTHTSTRPSRPSRVKSEAIQPRHRVSTYNPAIVSQLDNNRQSFPVFLPHTSQGNVFPVFIYTCTYYVHVDGTRQAHKNSLLGDGGFENVDRHSIGTRAHHVWWACLRRGYVSSMMRAS